MTQRRDPQPSFWITLPALIVAGLGIGMSVTFW